MKWPCCWTLGVVLLAGCQMPTAAIDPFFGRQTVPPPGTGVASNAPPPGEYYNPQSGATSPPLSSNTGGANFVPPSGSYLPPGGSFLPSGSSATAGTSGSPGGTYVPPGGNYGYAGNTAPAAGGTAARPAASGIPVRSASPADRPASGGTSFPINTNPPTSSGFNNGASATPPPAFNTSPPTTRTASVPNSRYSLPATGTRTDIMDLPAYQPNRNSTGTGSTGSLPTGSSGSSLNSSGSSSGFRPAGSIRRASFEEPSGSSGSSSASALRPGSEYGHASDYTWLKGRLEYSRIDDRWKLRYIPIDGETDDYGGSVVLLGSRLLEGMESGDFVAAYGTLGQRGVDGQGFAPSFQLQRVERQAP